MELAKPKLFKELIRKRPITFDDGWRFIHNGIMKLENFIDGTTELKFCSEEYSNLYTVIYSMCTQRRPYDHCQQLYDKYKESNKEYIQSTVLPSLREKHGQYLLRELVERWGTYNLRVRWLSHFFQYLDRYFISRNELPSLKEVGLACFRDMVFQELSVSVKDAVISIIYQEREGEQIDSSLLKKVQDILVEIGNGKMNYFENGFEAHLLMDTSESVTSCFQGVEGFSFCGEANSEQKSKSGLPGKMGLGKMSGWMGTWEQADVLTGVAVIGAVVTIAMAYSFYRR